MTRFEPGSSGIGSDRAVNCATTTAHDIFVLNHLKNLIEKMYLYFCNFSYLHRQEAG